jgi:hypothetical protein
MIVGDRFRFSQNFLDIGEYGVSIYILSDIPIICWVEETNQLIRVNQILAHRS